MIDYKNTIKLIKKIDWKLILLVMVIFAYGLVILSSATHANQTGQYKRLIVQSLAFGIGSVNIYFNDRLQCNGQILQRVLYC